MKNLILFILLSFFLTGCYTSFYSVEEYRKSHRTHTVTYVNPLYNSSYCQTYYNYYLGDGYIPTICSYQRAMYINYYVERNVVRPPHITKIYNKYYYNNRTNRPNHSIRSNGLSRTPNRIHRTERPQRRTERVQRNRTSNRTEGRSSSSTRRNNNQCLTL